MDRREFLKKSVALGAVAGVSSFLGGIDKIYPEDSNLSLPDMVAIKDGMPDKMFDAGMKVMGGMKRFVKKGQTVLVKPNIGWDVEPERAGNTNPLLVKRIIQHCFEAGAKKVYVFDHTCDYWVSCYKSSGIEKAAKQAGAIVAPGNSKSNYQEVKIPGAKILQTVEVHELLLEADVFINVPILKSHGSSRITVGMKNLMGVVWNRGIYHSTDLHRTIAEFCLYRKPDLNIVDAYYVLKKGGPRGVSVNDVELLKNQIITTDILAADVAATKIFGLDPESIEFIKIANELKIGQMDLNQLKIKKISV
jgi:uncharacterized protein (DUF362 family)